MKKQLSIYTIVFVLSMLISIPVLAGNKGTDMDHSAHVGEKIHESYVQGYRFAYHLLDLPGRDARHLMTYILNPEGRAVTKAKIGYLVKGPEAATQKVMAMAMKDSFGGDVRLSDKGIYVIKTKAVIGDMKLFDSFTYEVK